MVEAGSGGVVVSNESLTHLYSPYREPNITRTKYLDILGQ
jgi:hypothetical protein